MSHATQFKSPAFGKISLLAIVISFSALAAADCAEDCQAEYDDCLKYSKSVAKEKVCGAILRECKLTCASNGE